MLKKILQLCICLTVNILSAQTDSLVGDDHTDLVAINALLREAGSHLGTGYRGGGKSPAGFDCSGFVRSIYEQTIGLVLPRRARDQASVTEKIEQQELRPGDLVFFNTQGGSHSHVGIYVGKGRFVHAPSKGGTVRLEKITSSYWSQRYTEAGRIIQK